MIKGNAGTTPLDAARLTVESPAPYPTRSRTIARAPRLGADRRDAGASAEAIERRAASLALACGLAVDVVSAEVAAVVEVYEENAA